jgi:acyl-coenzyme A thioesterase PaaI-like protein
MNESHEAAGLIVPTGLSIQERLYPQLPCFGCGHANADGLRLRSYPVDEAPDDQPAPPGAVTTAQFTPWPAHNNGFGYLNGGIIATVLDCHSASAVVLEAERRGWPPLPGAALPYVTAGLDIRYLRPSPLDEAVTLRAVVTEATESEMRAEVELLWAGKVRAAATSHWKRWRPRS